MAYNNQEKDTRPAAPFDLFVMTLWAPSTAPGKRAMFKIDVDAAGRVTFMVRTGDPADKEKAKDGDVIRMKMNYWDFEKVVHLFGDVVRAKGEMKVAVVEQQFFRFNKDTKQRERIDTPRDGNKLFFVKDSEGKIAISLVQYNRPQIEFGFLAERPEFVFAHADGSKFSDAEMSQSAARSYHKLLSELHQRIQTSMIRQHQVPDQYKPPFVPQQQGGNGGGNGGYQNRGGNGGGYNNGGNSGGGAQRQQAAVVVEEDDDIPY
jgi:uncharacterized membrane protein YgcG